MARKINFRNNPFVRTSPVLSLLLLVCLTVSCVPGTGFGPFGAGGTPSAWTLKGVETRERLAVVDGTLIFLTRQDLRGVDVLSGRELWKVPFLPELRRSTLDNPWFAIARGAVVLVESPERYEPSVTRAFDPGTGRLLWSNGIAHGVTVTQDAVFIHTCDTNYGDCTTARREPRSGEVAWSGVPNPIGWMSASDHPLPFAPPTGRYFATDATRKGTVLRDAENGRRITRASARDWFDWYPVGSDVILFDSEEGDGFCPMKLSSFAGGQFRPKWKRTACFPLAGERIGYNPGFLHATGKFIGTDTRIATLTPRGGTQVLDLTNGDVLWRSAESGTPLDSDGAFLLTRPTPHQGPLTMLDFASGRALWTVPDPGLAPNDSRWRTVVNGGFTAVSEARGNDASVAVYETSTGRLLTRHPGVFKGAGDGWIAVVRFRGAREDLDFFFV
ncbi:hypothetical protein GCM10009550_06860 [Actinocorallia libanotica]|uniref:Pyrrolo-quinoline quinone repeat domain-containing protein n=1 Tax=Actinocorallia libanotica TaxID=46162 RepID=A0ABN1Q8Y5_9ACTN